MERQKNGQVYQRLQRRPRSADAAPRTTHGFFAAPQRGLADAQSARKTRESSFRTTLNGYHQNGSVNGSLNSETARETTSQRSRPPQTAWELPGLIRPLPVRRRPRQQRPRLLAHYPAVVEYVYRSRYATGSQIRRRFPEYLASERTAQYQLANLVQLDHLATSPVRSTSPNFPFVYHATGRGVHLVSQTYASLGRRWSAAATEQFRSRGQSLDSILHEVLLTEFDLAVSKTIESRGDLDLLLAERRYFRRERQLRFSHQGKLRRVVPDSGFLLRIRSQTSGRLAAQRSNLLLHLVELDNGTMPIARILEKYRRYHHWAESHEGRRYLTGLYRRFGRPQAKPNFRLLVIAHAKTDAGGDLRRLADLLTQALLLPSSMRDRIWLTTAEDLRWHQEDNPPLSAAIWLRARDARKWLPAYRTFCEQLPGGRGNKRYAHQRRFAAEQIATFPRHPLFPAPDTVSGLGTA